MKKFLDISLCGLVIVFFGLVVLFVASVLWANHSLYEIFFVTLPLSILAIATALMFFVISRYNKD